MNMYIHGTWVKSLPLLTYECDLDTRRIVNLLPKMWVIMVITICMRKFQNIPGLSSSFPPSTFGPVQRNSLPDTGGIYGSPRPYMFSPSQIGAIDLTIIIIIQNISTMKKEMVTFLVQDLEESQCWSEPRQHIIVRMGLHQPRGMWKVFRGLWM